MFLKIKTGNPESEHSELVRCAYLEKRHSKNWVFFGEAVESTCTHPVNIHVDEMKLSVFSVNDGTVTHVYVVVINEPYTMNVNSNKGTTFIHFHSVKSLLKKANSAVRRIAKKDPHVILHPFIVFDDRDILIVNIFNKEFFTEALDMKGSIEKELSYRKVYFSDIPVTLMCPITGVVNIPEEFHPFFQQETCPSVEYFNLITKNYDALISGDMQHNA